MHQTMRAAVYRGPGTLTVEEQARPLIDADGLLIRVTNCGVCGSDVHSFRSGMFVRPGQVLGHELVGRVAAVGRNVAGFDVDDRVTGFSVGVCGGCFWCSRGQFNLCPELFHRSTGYGRPGALAEYVAIPEATRGVNVHHIPDSIDDRAAAMVEPVSVAVGAVGLAGVRAGDQVVVLGGGAIGNACMQVAKAAGASKVVLVEASRARLDAALACGADAAFDARQGDALEWVKTQVGAGPYHFGIGAMADVVIEAAGVPETVRQSLEMVRSGGTVAFVALAEHPAQIDVTKIVHKSPRIVGCLAGDFPRAIELLATGAVRTAPLIGDVMPLDQVQQAFEAASNPDSSVKTLVAVSPEPAEPD